MMKNIGSSDNILQNKLILSCLSDLMKCQSCYVDIMKLYISALGHARKRKFTVMFIYHL